MSTLVMHNFTSTSMDTPDLRTIEALKQWRETGGITKDYLLSIINGSFDTTDVPFGLPGTSSEKMTALEDGIKSARAGEIVDLGSFSQYADDDVSEG